MSYDIHGRKVPKLYVELGIIVLGLIITALAIWFFDAWPYLVSWAWFFAGVFIGMLALCLIVAFFMFGARGESTAAEELERPELNTPKKAKPRLVQNGKSKPNTPPR